MDLIELKWKRPGSSEFPKVWRTFKAKDRNSDKLVEYRIDDLTESRKEDAMKMLVERFCNGEPLCTAFGVSNDPVAKSDLTTFLWIPVFKQNMVFVCYRSGSDEIVGLNMNFVAYSDEDFYGEAEKRVVNDKNIKQFGTIAKLYEDFDVCEHYAVDKYLGSAGMVVKSEYRGRGIGEQFLRAREPICKKFDIKLTSTSFTSDFSNRLADKAGFKLDKILRYDDVRDKYPELELPTMTSDAKTIKSILY